MKYSFNRITTWLSAALVGLLCMSYTPAQEPPSTNAFPATGTGGVFNVTFTRSGEYDILVTHPSGQSRRLYLVATNRDNDNDGMPDWWEYQYWGGTSPAGTNDYDGDSLSNSNEYLQGTDPTNSDTDSDGMTDGWEVTHGLDSKVNDAGGDPDGDRLLNLQEFGAGTDPGNPNTDGDSVSDYHEWIIQSNPNDVTSPNSYWVSNLGSDTNAGSETDPFFSINHAVASVITPAIIHIWAGTYPEAIKLGTNHTGIGLLGVTNVEGIITVGASGTPITLASVQFYFNDANENSIWNSDEGVWIDQNTNGQYDVAQDTVVVTGGGIGALDSTFMRATALDGTYISDDNQDSLFDPNEAVWIDVGTQTGSYDSADIIIREGESAAVSLVGSDNVFLENIHAAGPNMAITSMGSSRVFIIDVTFDASSKRPTLAQGSEISFIKPRLSVKQGIVWIGNSPTEVWQMEVKP